MTALIVGFGLVVSVVIFFAARNTSENAAEETVRDEASVEVGPTLPSITPEEAKKKFFSETPAKIIDIRSETEYQTSHIPDSLSMPAEKLGEYFPATEGEEILVVPARDETVSAKASEIFSKKNVRYAFIKGGLFAWGKSGGQVVTFGNPSSPIDRSKITFVSAEEFKQAVENQEILRIVVDVRSKEAFAKSHIPKAVNIPLPELERRRSEIPPATNVALYAESDLDAFQAAVRLFDFGIFSVETLEIGFSGWEAKGMPIEIPKSK